jgi:hypothetical protein
MTDITLLGTGTVPGTLVVTDCGDRHLFDFCENAVCLKEKNIFPFHLRNAKLDNRPWNDRRTAEKTRKPERP